MEIGETLGLTTGVLGLTAAALVAMVIWQGVASWRAARLASRDDAYRRLAENVTETLRRIEDRQLRVMAALAKQPGYGQAVHDAGMNRPLLQMRLRRLEAVGPGSGKTMKFYDIEPFSPKQGAKAAES